MKTVLLTFALLCVGFHAQGQQKSIRQPALKSATDLNRTTFIPLYTDTLVSIRLKQAKLNEFKTNNVDLSAKASELLGNYAVVPPESNQPKIISKKILDDGGIETTYADQSKRIKYEGGITTIAPDGTEMKMLFMQTQPFEPPTDPSDPDIAKYLIMIHDGLSESLASLLGHDTESITNFENGDTGLTIYQQINRRIAIIDYLIAQP